jgi:hypothetical protein
MSRESASRTAAEVDGVNGKSGQSLAIVDGKVMAAADWP